MPKFFELKTKNNKISLLICALAAVAFLAVMYFFSGSLVSLMNFKRKLFWCGFYAAVLFAVCAYFAFVKRVNKVWLLFVLAFATGAALGIRIMLFEHKSGDYISFIADWIRRLAEYPGVSGWRVKIGDYNMPYLYLLTMVSKLPGFEHYQVKTFSVLADILVAYYLMRLSSFKLKDIKLQIAVFCSALFIPTVVYNGAYWGQCDSIYTAFVLAFLYYAISNRPALSCVMLGIAFSFKLQAIFIFPMLLAFWLVKKLKLWHILLVPASFLAVMLPAIFAGRSLADTFSIYFVQASKNEHLVLNAPNVYQFINNVDLQSFTTAGIMFTGAALLCLVFFVYKYAHRMDSVMLVKAAFLCAFIFPMFLPQMHERYFFIADCLSLLMPFFNKKKVYVPIAVVYCSYRAYASFEMNDASVNMRLLAIIMMVTLAACAVSFIQECTENGKICAKTDNTEV